MDLKMIFLKIEINGRELEDFKSNKETITIGTDPTSSFQIEGGNLASHHARIDTAALTLTGFNNLSQEPVILNGEEIATTKILENGDKIQIGYYTFKFFHDRPIWGTATNVATMKVSSNAPKR